MELCAKRATDFQKVLAPPPSSNGHGTGGVGTAIESPTFSNRPQPWGRPELAGKSCFPTEVRSKLPKLPARSSPSFLHQIDRVRHQEPDRIIKEIFEGSKVGPMSTDIQSDYSLVSALDFASRTWCPETCQDCGSADSASPRPARIADQADYGPLHPARATRADLVSPRNLPAGQADHSPLISPSNEKCIGSTTGPLLTSTLQSQVEFWDWSKYRGDSAEFSAEV
ncbi:hypothetical protein Prudu_725S000100 [Prunus dulcis]|uniref:Uncharacterized protein n=1 Tax=Prunus dulcis TaxID=3755 RepID=A0A5H2XLX3_PRUDU|nr:hypothetical protein Prudu_725S000100 [Prunus dulcis]